MGVLANAFGFGSPTQAAQSSLAYGGAGVGLTAASQLFGGVGSYQQAMFQAQVAQNNAAIMRQNAQMATEAGGYEESVSKLRTGQEVGAERAAQGANNVDVNVGSPAQVRESTQTLGAMDAAMIHYNAAKEAYGYGVEAQTAAAQAQLFKRAAVGGLVAGGLGAGASLLGGGASLASKWAQFRLSGAT